MASELVPNVVRDSAGNVIGVPTAQENSNVHGVPPTISPDSFDFPEERTTQGQVPRSLVYEWTTNESLFSRDVDQWISGDPCPGARSQRPGTTAGTPHSAIFDRTMPDATSNLEPGGFWYFLAMLLPLFTINGRSNWRCTTSTVLSTVEVLLTHVAGCCSRARARIRSMTSNNAASDLFTSLMNLTMLAYAVGFFILALYQTFVLHSI